MEFSIQEVFMNHKFGDDFCVPCNIEMGVNTTQSNYILDIERLIVYGTQSLRMALTSFEHLLQYNNTLDPVQTMKMTKSLKDDPTFYSFSSSSLTLDVMNFSAPNFNLSSPQNSNEIQFDVDAVSFICGIRLQDMPQPSALTVTHVIVPALFGKLIKFCKTASD